MSEYVKCPLCGIETKANEAHGCAGPRVEVIDPRDARIAALEAELAESEAACVRAHFNADAQLEHIERQLDGINGASEYSDNLLNALRESVKRMRAENQAVQSNAAKDKVKP